LIGNPPAARTGEQAEDSLLVQVLPNGLYDRHIRLELRPTRGAVGVLELPTAGETLDDQVALDLRELRMEDRALKVLL
jgi:hypothetical protein